MGWCTFKTERECGRERVVQRMSILSKMGVRVCDVYMNEWATQICSVNKVEKQNRF